MCWICYFFIYFLSLLQYTAGKHEIRRRENRCLLAIVNCSKEDEATYECKVTQGDAVTKCVLNCEGMCSVVL